ncbi:MAG: type II secretion system protein [bacterium]|nr:type II secretion system protein [bacterium]
MKKSASQKGFTLIELVVVMTVLAFLATLVVGAIIIGQRQSKNTKYLNDAKDIKAALEAYRINEQSRGFSGKYPYCETCGGGAGANYSRINAYDLLNPTLTTKTAGQAAGDLTPYVGSDVTGPADRICYSSYGTSPYGGDYWFWIITEEEAKDHVCRCPSPNPGSLKCGYYTAAEGSKIHCPKAVADDPQKSIDNGCFKEKSF